MFTSTTASAPASWAATAIEVRSLTLGLSLAHSGSPQTDAAPTASAVVDGEWANMRLRSSRLGHETLTSTATTPAGASDSISAARRYSSTDRPQMLATTRAPVASTPGSSSSNQRATPGPWRPTLLIIPAGVSWTRGAALPAHGSGDSDFTTTAPMRDRST